MGLSIKTCQQIHVAFNLGVHRTLKTSLNKDIKNLYKLTSIMNLNPDSTLEKINSTEKRIIKNRSDALLSTQSKYNTWNSFFNVKEQCDIISFFVNLIPPTHWFNRGKWYLRYLTIFKLLLICSIKQQCWHALSRRTL